MPGMRISAPSSWACAGRSEAGLIRASLIGRVPFGHWNTMTFVAGLRHDGIVAPWGIDGPINGAAFRTDVEQGLVPTLRPDDIVVMDTLGSHNAPAVRQAIRAAGASCSTCPPPRPASIRSNRSSSSSSTCCARPPNAEAVWRRIGSLLDQVTPQECQNYTRNSRYGSL